MEPYVAKLTKERHTQRTISILKTIVSALIISFAILLIVCSIIYSIARKSGKSFTVVASNSMTPTYNVMDTIIYSSKSGETPYIPGDNIVFIMHKKDGETTQVFHKLIRVSEGYDRFYTKGIANNSEDEGFRLISDIIGSEDYHVKWKFFGMLIILISRTDPLFVLFVSFAIIALVTLVQLVGIFGPKISRNETALIDKMSLESFQRMLSEYNAYLENCDYEKATAVYNKIKEIKLHLRNLEDDTPIFSEKVPEKKDSVKQDIVVEKTSSKPKKVSSKNSKKSDDVQQTVETPIEETATEMVSVEENIQEVSQSVPEKDERAAAFNKEVEERQKLLEEIEKQKAVLLEELERIKASAQ